MALVKQMLTRLFPMGWVAALGGIMIGILATRDAIGQGWEFLPVAGGFGGLITGKFFWWLLIVRRARYTIWRGIVAGVLTGVVGHYTTWYLVLLTAYISYQATGQPVSSLGEPPVDQLFGFIGAAGLTLWGLILFGWLMVPVGALSGAAIAALQHRRFAKPGASEPQTGGTA